MKTRHSKPSGQLPLDTQTLKQERPRGAKRSVSAATIFKHAGYVRKNAVKNKLVKHNVQQLTSDATMRTAKPTYLRENSHTQGLDCHRKDLSKHVEHHLTTEFKDASDTYRRHLYTSATTKIDTTLNALLQKLHQSDKLSTPSDDGEGPLIVRLSIPQQYAKLAKALYEPLSPSLTSEPQGKVQQKNLSDRMMSLQGVLKRQTREVQILQNQWEDVVGEIWRLGAICVGESVMNCLVLGPETRSGDGDADEGGLFVPETEVSVQKQAGKGKRKVTFNDDVNMNNTTTCNSTSTSLPAFFSRLPPVPSTSQAGLSSTPNLSVRDLESLQAKVASLGAEHLQQMARAEEEYKGYWRRKERGLKKVLEED